MSSYAMGRTKRVLGRFFSGCCGLIVCAVMLLLIADFVMRCMGGLELLWQEAFELTEKTISQKFPGKGTLGGIINIVIGVPMYAIHFAGILTWPLPLAWLCWLLLRAMRKHPMWWCGAFRAPAAQTRASRPQPTAPAATPGQGGAQVHRGANLLLAKVWLMRFARVIVWAVIIAALVGVVCGYRFVVLQPDYFPEEPGSRTLPLAESMSAWAEETAGDVPFLGDLLMFAVLLLGLVLGLAEIALTLLWPVLLGLLIVLIAAAFGTHFANQQHILEAGVEGEKTALELAQRLPSSCHVFTNQVIWFEPKNDKRKAAEDGKQSRKSETDLILVGPGGVAIVEVKNYSGRLTGNAWDHDLMKTSPSGRKDMVYNPAKQVSTHVWRLSNYLKSKGQRAWITPYVLFTNPRTTFDIRTKGYSDDDSETAVDKRSQVTYLGVKDFGQIVRAMTGENHLRPEQIDDIVWAISSNRRP